MKQRFPTCPTQNKDMYPSQKIALRVLLSCSKRRGTPLRLYYRRDCKSFHITKQARSSRDNDNRGAVA